jgi:hypothetical protein
MDSSDYVACIRKAADAPEAQRALAAVGFTEKLTMPEDDIDARVDAPEHGLSLIFKPESEISGGLIVTAVKFYSDREDGFTAFQGALPSGLSFSDTRTEVLKKLGEPRDAMPELRRDIWQWNDLQLAIKYAKAAPGQLAVITVEVPFDGDD